MQGTVHRIPSLAAEIGATLAAATGRQLFLLAAEVPAIGGSTIRNIAAAHHIEIVPPQTGLVARRAAIHLPTVKPAPDSRSADRAATCLATALDPV